MDACVFVRVSQQGNKTRYRRTPVKIEPVGIGFGASGAAASSAIGSAAPNSGKSVEDSGSVRVIDGLKPADIIVQNGALGLYNEMEEQAKGQ